MDFTQEQLLTRWEQLRAIKNLMGRLSADYTLKKEGEMYETYWSTREDVSLGINEGWFVGKSNVKRYYRELSDYIAFQSRLIQSIFPEELGNVPEDTLQGVGVMDYKPIDTPVVEIAEDGQTAKGLWCIRGSHSKITTSGPVGYWEWGYFAADFILEDGEFKLWHLQYLQEVCRPNGHVWYGDEYEYPELEEFLPITGRKLPVPDHPARLRERYHIDRPFTPPPRVPEPYDTFSHTFTYGWKEEL